MNIRFKNNPDFSRYTQDQLRQILTTIDAERFPERAEEVANRLAACEQVPDRPTAAPIESGAERLRISSDLAKIGYVIFPFLLFGPLLWLLITDFRSTNTWLIVIVGALLGALGHYKIARLASTVDLAGEHLIAWYRDRERIVRLADIDRIEVVNDETLTVKLHLLRDSGFGLVLEFVPAQELRWNLFRENSAVAELARRIKLAKTGS